MKLGRDALITIIVAIISGILPHVFGNSMVVTIICIVLGIAAFVYGLAAFRSKEKNVWNIVALVLAVCGIVSAVINIIGLIKA